MSVENILVGKTFEIGGFLDFGGAASSSQVVEVAHENIYIPPAGHVANPIQINLAKLLNLDLNEILTNKETLVSQKFRFLADDIYMMQKNVLSSQRKFPNATDAFPEDHSVIFKDFYAKKINELEQKKSEKIINSVAFYITNNSIYNMIKNEKMTTEQFCFFIQGNQELYRRQYTLSKNITKMIRQDYSDLKFLGKWGRFLRAEIAQECYPSDDVLGKDVSFGMVRRIYFDCVAQENIELEELVDEMEICPFDRYLQAAYMTNKKICGPTNEYSPFQIENNKLKPKELFALLTTSLKEDLFDALFENGNLYDGAEGWLELDLCFQSGNKHPILVRWDNAKGHYWVIDSNIGLFSFDKPKAKGQIEQQVNCSRFIERLITLMYPKAVGVRGLVYKITFR